MSKVAIISDIHANLEALTAVLDHVDQQGIEDIICLGDIVGYGPDPIACTEMVRSRCRAVICGNHDEALVKGPYGFNQLARDSIEWTRKQMRPRFYRWGSAARWKFLADLPLTLDWGDYLMVHGSPRDPTSEYVLPHDAQWPQPGKFEEIFKEISTVCFVGHTHVPGVFYEGPTFVPQSEITEPFSYAGTKLLVNVGSVGQPRDQNPRACYLVIDGDEFRFCRVDYSFRITQEKIRAIPKLDNRLADRLEDGE